MASRMDNQFSRPREFYRSPITHSVPLTQHRTRLQTLILVLACCSSCNRSSMTDLTEHDPLFIRTDSANDTGWKSVKREVGKPVSDLGITTTANVRFIDDESYRGLDVQGVIAALPPDFNGSFFFVADDEACSDPEHPIIVVDMMKEQGRHFRAIPKMISDIESNLSISNCDFVDYLADLSDDGVHRGYADTRHTELAPLPKLTLTVPHAAERFKNYADHCRLTLHGAGVNIRISMRQNHPNFARDKDAQRFNAGDNLVSKWQSDVVTHYRIDTSNGSAYAIVTSTDASVLKELELCFGSVSLSQ